MFNLQVSDVKRLLVDVGSVRPGSQSGHSCQVAAVAAHRLNDEDAPLGPAGRLLDAVTSLTQAKEPVSVNFNMYDELQADNFTSHDASIRWGTDVKTTRASTHNLNSTCNAGTLRPECCPLWGCEEHALRSVFKRKKGGQAMK